MMKQEETFGSDIINLHHTRCDVEHYQGHIWWQIYIAQLVNKRLAFSIYAKNCSLDQCKIVAALQCAEQK